MGVRDKSQPEPTLVQVSHPGTGAAIIKHRLYLINSYAIHQIVLRSPRETPKGNAQYFHFTILLRGGSHEMETCIKTCPKKPLIAFKRKISKDIQNASINSILIHSTHLTFAIKIYVELTFDSLKSFLWFKILFQSFPWFKQPMGNQRCS